jgi:hypothetical protein
MDKMSVPGFSADASLYANTATYRPAGAGYSGGRQQVVPQFWRELGNAIKEVGNALLGGVKCTAATAILGAACGAIAETGDVAACTDATQEWVENCFD